jgi:hypothetical protein
MIFSADVAVVVPVADVDAVDTTVVSSVSRLRLLPSKSQLLPSHSFQEKYKMFNKKFLEKRSINQTDKTICV